MADIDEPNLLGEHPLLTWRRARSWTLQGMAKRAETTSATISRIEHRKLMPSYPLARRLAAITGITVETFLERLS